MPLLHELNASSKMICDNALATGSKLAIVILSSSFPGDFSLVLYKYDTLLSDRSSMKKVLRRSLPIIYLLHYFYYFLDFGFHFYSYGVH
jgi:hypothetical protein